MVCLPLDDRAHKWRAQSDQIGEFRNKIIIQEADNHELKRALKSKLDEVSEMQIRRDLAEKKLSTAQKETALKQEELNRMVREYHEKEAEWERMQIKYNQEMKEMYSDNQSMREKFKDYSKNLLIGKIMNSPSVASSLGTSPGATPSSHGMSFQTAMGSPGGFSTSSTVMSSESSDVNELHQQVIDLRTALKRMAKRNYELRVLLSSNPSSASDVNKCENGLANASTLKPMWYVESLRRSNRSQLNGELAFPKFGSDMKELKLQEMRNKLLEFKYEVLKERCTTSIIPCTERIAKKPGWTRNLGDLLKKSAQEESMHQLDNTRRYRELRTQVEDFVRTFEDGNSCDGTFASFIAPHISKVSLLWVMLKFN